MKPSRILSFIVPFFYAFNGVDGASDLSGRDLASTILNDLKGAGTCAACQVRFLCFHPVLIIFLRACQSKRNPAVIALGAFALPAHLGIISIIVYIFHDENYSDHMSSPP